MVQARPLSPPVSNNCEVSGMNRYVASIVLFCPCCSSFFASESPDTNKVYGRASGILQRLQRNANRGGLADDDIPGAVRFGVTERHIGAVQERG
jgi:hypothetical protein